jgi:hypothetical protein
MRSSLALPAVFALVLLLAGCTLIDVKWAPDRDSHNHGFVNGYVDAGWPASDSLLKLAVFDGPSHGAILYLQLWKLLRVEVGFVGLALGVGPLDAGVGIFVYHPKPPVYVECKDECEEEAEAAALRHDEAIEGEAQQDEAADAKADEHPFVYDAY